MQPTNFDEILDKIAARDTRYHRDAYLFVRGALDFAQKPLAKSRKMEVCHVSGQELLAGIRAYALEMYGPMAKALLNEWGIRTCEDFGEIVFNMVDSGLLSKTEQDSREDFKGGYDFHEAFCKPFLPSNLSKPQEIPPTPSEVRTDSQAPE